MSSRNAVLAGITLATIAAGALRYLDAEPVATFAVPELFIVLFALSAGELVVARTSIVSDWFVSALDPAVDALGIPRRSPDS